MAHKLIPELHEQIAEVSPTTAGFGQDGGSATMEFEVSRGDLPKMLEVILGQAAINANGSLKRTVPMSHPDYPWLYASRINTIQGLGANGWDRGDKFIFPGFGSTDKTLPERREGYRVYKLTVQFEPRPYLVLTDEQTHRLVERQAYFNEAGVEVQFDDYAEYLRFCTVDFEPSSEYLVAQMGSYFLHSRSLKASPQQVTPTNAGGPKMLVNRNKMIVKWFMVPNMMVRSEHLKLGRGKVNFDAWPLPASDFFGQENGSLLLEGIKFSPNPGPYPPFSVDPATRESLTNSYWNSRYVDITFEFSEFTIPKDQRGLLPDLGGAGAMNNSYVLDNHNRLPHVGLMRWVYACNNADVKQGRPLYDSFNMKALFTYKGP
jgi:hypothetical protein